MWLEWNGSGGEWEEANWPGATPIGAVGSHGRIWSDISELPGLLYGEWQCRRDLTAEEKPKESGGWGALP